MDATAPENALEQAPDLGPELGSELAPELAPVELLVCTTCRRGLPTDTEGPRPGVLLAKALGSQDWPANVTLKETECLSNCSSGCSIALRGGPARWTYVYGNFIEGEHIDTIVEGVSKYAATDNGLVPWRERPEHFRKNCIARIPPLQTPDEAQS